MADEIDRANDHAQAILDACIDNNRKVLPKGEPGICSCCDEHSQRLINGACAPCRDLLHLP